MPTLRAFIGGLKVALRKESVDRNVGGVDRTIDIIKSLSARRAWIEMLLLFWSIWR